jgi:hypothetical protein
MSGDHNAHQKPCAGRNCGSTNPNLHSAECFEDYEKSTGMNHFNPDWDTVKAFDDRYNKDTELLRQCLEALNRSDYLGWQLNIPIIKALRKRLEGHS